VITVRCPTEADTRALGRRLASLIRTGDVVLLGGGLGVGKTVFVSGLGEGLGVAEAVLSPTFVLARHYRGLIDMVHADIYRVGTIGELDDLELMDLAADGVLVVEWGDAAEANFPDDHLLVRLEVEGDGCRLATLLPKGSWEDRPLREVVP
jgi:tRNA threonylcarbamoyladenosine biosynthesis protein TsaE